MNDLVPARSGRPCGSDIIYVPELRESLDEVEIEEIVLLHERGRGLMRLHGAPLLRVRGQGARVTTRRDMPGITVEGETLDARLEVGEVRRTLVHTVALDGPVITVWDSRRGTLAVEAPSAGVAIGIALHGDLDEVEEAERGGRLVTHGPVHLVAAATVDGAIAAGDVMRRGINDPADSLANVPAGAPPRATANLWSCRLGAIARTVDTGRMVPLSARSPRNDTPGLTPVAEWARGALPALCRVDPAAARHGLIALCSVASAAPGSASFDPFGAVFDGGFRLDVAADPALAVERYVRLTSDDSVLADPSVRDALAASAAALTAHHDPQTGLFGTQLAPGGSEPPGAFLAAPGAMAVRAYELLAGWGFASAPQLVPALRATWHNAFVRQGWIVGALGADGQPFAWDDPAASILTLPRIGILDPHAMPSWFTTVDRLVSAGDPGWLDGRFAGQRHPTATTPAASMVSLADRLAAFAPNDPRADVAREGAIAAPLTDDGIACRAYDPKSGVAVDGPEWAAGAGMFAEALLWSFGLTP